MRSALWSVAPGTGACNSLLHAPPLTLVVLADLLGGVDVGGRVEIGDVGGEERDDRHELGVSCNQYGTTHDTLDSVHGQPPLASVLVSPLVLSGRVLGGEL